jgi:hypothetical protein
VLSKLCLPKLTAADKMAQQKADALGIGKSWISIANRYPLRINPEICAPFRASEEQGEAYKTGELAENRRFFDKQENAVRHFLWDSKGTCPFGGSMRAAPS